MSIVRRLKIYGQPAGKIVSRVYIIFIIRQKRRWVFMDIITIGEWTYFINVEWRQIIIDGKATNYDVSNIGEVRNRTTGKILSQYTDKDGYKHATIMVDGKQYHPGVHRFVAIAFIPNPENKPEVNHLNGVKYINVVDNLEWATSSENVQHAFDTGLKSSILGSDNVLSHYTDEQIHSVCKLLEKGVSHKKISKKTGVDRKYITDIRKGRRWKHISKLYDIKPVKYPPEMRAEIFALLQEGKTPHQIIDDLGLEHTQAYVSLIERIKRNQRLSASTTIPKGSTATS